MLPFTTAGFAPALNQTNITTMQTDIKKKWSALESRRRGVIEKLEKVSVDRLTFKADPQRWSVVEIIQHLVIVEQQMIRQATTHPIAPGTTQQRSNRQAMEKEYR